MSFVNQCCLHTPYLTIIESYSKFRWRFVFFHHTFHFRILPYTCGSRALFTVSRQQHFVFLVSVHSAAIPPTSPTHTIHSLPVYSYSSPFSVLPHPSLTLCWSSFLPDYSSPLCFTTSPTPCSSSFFTRLLLLFCVLPVLHCATTALPLFLVFSLSYKPFSISCSSPLCVLPLSVVPSLHCPYFAHVASLF